MNNSNKNLRAAMLISLALSVAVITGCANPMSNKGANKNAGAQLSLSGAQEVPAVSTAATGVSNIMVGPDKSVTGSVTTTGIDGRAAHIHLAAPGQNGPVIVPLAKTADNTWSVPSGAKLTDEQFASYQAGNLYVNVHTAAHPAGELRAQLKPK